MDKDLRDGGEQEDPWSGEGAEALARNLLVDGETGESFPAQVPTPLPAPPKFTARLASGNFPLEKALSGTDLNVLGGSG